MDGLLELCKFGTFPFLPNIYKILSAQVFLPEPFCPLGFNPVNFFCVGIVVNSREVYYHHLTIRKFFVPELFNKPIKVCTLIKYGVARLVK